MGSNIIDEEDELLLLLETSSNQTNNDKQSALDLLRITVVKYGAVYVYLPNENYWATLDFKEFTAERLRDHLNTTSKKANIAESNVELNTDTFNPNKLNYLECINGTDAVLQEFTPESDPYSPVILNTIISCFTQWAKNESK